MTYRLADLDELRKLLAFREPEVEVIIEEASHSRRLFEGDIESDVRSLAAETGYEVV